MHVTNNPHVCWYLLAFELRCLVEVLRVADVDLAHHGLGFVLEDLVHRVTTSLRTRIRKVLIARLGFSWVRYLLQAYLSFRWSVSPLVCTSLQKAASIRACPFLPSMCTIQCCSHGLILLQYICSEPEVRHGEADLKQVYSSCPSRVRRVQPS